MNDLAGQNISSKKHCLLKVHIAVKQLNPCFVNTSVQNKYLKVIFGKSGAYKSKYSLKPLLRQNMVHFTSTTKSGSMD